VLARRFVLAFALLGACAAPRPVPSQTPPPVAALDAARQPLRARFDADAARARLLVLASPT